MGGEVLGDTDPVIIGTAIRQLQSLVDMPGKSKDEFPSDPGSVLAFFKGNVDEFDASLRPMAESLDEFAVHAWIAEDFAHFFLAKGTRQPFYDSPRTAAVCVAEYDSIVRAVADYCDVA